jgi:ribosomal protein L30/L7E
MKKGKKGNKEEESGKELIAFLLVKGISEVEPHHRYTLDSLKLKKKHSLVVTKNLPSFRGMIRSLNELGIWGEVSKEGIKKIESKRKPVYSSDSISVFNLSPPKGGFKKSIKRGSPKGILGKKDEKSFLDILNRMI